MTFPSAYGSGVWTGSSRVPCLSVLRCLGSTRGTGRGRDHQKASPCGCGGAVHAGLGSWRERRYVGLGFLPGRCGAIRGPTPRRARHKPFCFHGPDPKAPQPRHFASLCGQRQIQGFLWAYGVGIPYLSAEEVSIALQEELSGWNT